MYMCWISKEDKIDKDNNQTDFNPVFCFVVLVFHMHMDDNESFQTACTPDEVIKPLIRIS